MARKAETPRLALPALLLLAACLLAVPLACRAQAQGGGAARASLLSNGSMSAGDALPAGWGNLYTTKGKLRAFRDTADYQKAPASLCLASVGGPADGNVSYPLHGVAGKTLEVSGYVKSRSEGAGLQDAEVLVFAMDRAGKVVLWGGVCPWDVAKSTDWKAFSGTAKVPQTAQSVVLMLYLRGEGRVWLDEAQVFDTSATNPAEVKPWARTKLSPKVVRVSTVAPDILSVAIQAGKVQPSSLTRYVAQPGDTRRDVKGKDGKVRQVLLSRGGREIGWLIGPKRGWLVTYEKVIGDKLQGDLAGWTGSYTISSRDDPAYAAGLKPTAVYRKSKPTDWAIVGRGFAMRHIIYLKLPKPLTPGKTYTVDLGKVNVQNPRVDLTWDVAKVRSEAVHADQIGYRPDDPVKRAFLSVWLGTGGAHRYPAGLGFHLVDDVTGKTVYFGKVELVLPVDGKEKMNREVNLEKTAVYRMDFSDFSRPGRYRVVVDGVGCSYPFEIGVGVWRRALVLQMKGLYNERSTAIGPPYSAFHKPRDFFPADGAKVYYSTYSYLDAGYNTKLLAADSTGKIDPNAWGGYHDAGDWNPRRVTHLRVTMAQLELLQMFPDYFRKLSWPLPAKTPVPSIMKEALFELSLFRRLQAPDGGVSWGIETDGDPIDGEVSWLQSMPAYVFAPDAWSSYIYAAVAGRAAKLLEGDDPTLAREYRESALRAMEWAEKDWAKRRAAGTLAKLPWEVKDDRNLAAVVLYDLTGDKRWNDVFMEDTCLKDAKPNLFVWGDHVQRDAAFAYALLPKGLGDPALKRKAVEATERQADQMLAFAKGNPFNITTLDKYRPMTYGFFSTPDAVELCRAHFLTGKREYLAGAVQANQFLSGCNPNDMTYTVGLGSNWPKHPLHLDSRRTGQPAPLGLTVYGNVDYIGHTQDSYTWPVKFYLSKDCVPSAWDWPITEAYFDICMYPCMNEFTVDAWAPNVYVWGYLAARK